MFVLALVVVFVVIAVLGVGGVDGVVVAAAVVFAVAVSMPRAPEQALRSIAAM